MNNKILIQEGITKGQIGQLLKYSREDEVIKKFTSDSKRFSDFSTFNKWQKNRKIFVLTNDKNDLLGIIWVGEKEMPKELKRKYPSYKTTFAIRLYNEARGKGLSRWFMEEVLKRIPETHIWLQCDSRNEAAQKLYAKFGFEPILSDKKTNSVCMIYENKK